MRVQEEVKMGYPVRVVIVIENDEGRREAERILKALEKKGFI